MSDATTDADRAKAADAIERGVGICRTCLAPIWDEGGTVGHSKRAEGWSDRIERGGDSLVCFKAIDYRHVPLTGREAAIYDRAYARGAEARAPCDRLTAAVHALAEEWENAADRVLAENWTSEVRITTANMLTSAAARLRAIAAANEEARA